jgi:hypothetical protein
MWFRIANKIMVLRRFPFWFRANAHAADQGLLKSQMLQSASCGVSGLKFVFCTKVPVHPGSVPNTHWGFLETMPKLRVSKYCTRNNKPAQLHSVTIEMKWPKQVAHICWTCAQSGYKSIWRSPRVDHAIVRSMCCVQDTDWRGESRPKQTYVCGTLR